METFYVKENSSENILFSKFSQATHKWDFPQVSNSQALSLLSSGRTATPERCWTRCWSSSLGCPPDTRSANCWGGWSGSHWRNASECLPAPLGLGGNEEGFWERVLRGATLLCCCNARMLVRFQSGMGLHICRGILEDKVRMFWYQFVTLTHISQPTNDSQVRINHSNRISPKGWLMIFSIWHEQ